jgi:hypothetical protein
MFKRLLSLGLASMLIQTMCCVQSAFANSKAEKQAQLAEKVRSGITNLGVGKDARVVVDLRDKRKLAGYVSEAGKDSFVITDSKTGMSTVVPYTDVTQVKGHNLTSGAKIAIAVGFIIALVIVVVIFADGS